MGAENAGGNRKPESGGRKSGRGSENPGNQTAEGRDAAAAAATAAAAAATGDPEEIEVVSGLSTVEGAGIPSPGEGDKRGRGRPKGSTKNKSSSAPAKKKSGGDVQQTKIMIQTMLTVAFNITAMRAGEHWKLTPDEASNLAEPIASILERHDLTEKAGAYGDYIALVVAVGAIIVPKVMVGMENKKRKGVHGIVVRNIQQPKQAAGAGAGAEPNSETDGGSGRDVQQGNTAYRPSDVKRHLAGITG